MYNFDIKDKCHISTNTDEDSFVGIKCKNGDIEINFPMGYNLSSNSRDLTKDIKLLINVLSQHTKKKKSTITKDINLFEQVLFPMKSYMYIIEDYYRRGGYFFEYEDTYNVSKSGKIHWNYTIKTQKPVIINENIIYLDFVTKKDTIDNTQLITDIHKYCVYLSFEKLGWLYSTCLPDKPRIVNKNNMFQKVISSKLMTVFKDSDKLLFKHMLAILNFEGDKNSKINYLYGTYRFEYVWESMIDKLFGVNDKSFYYPKSYWEIDNKVYTNACLRPDTIMIHNNNVCILDAKYYKYGITENKSDLPSTSSINKQISYAEYIDIDKYGNFRKRHGSNMKVYNAFLLPYQSKDVSINMISIGSCYSDWKDNSKKYHKIKGILLDTRFLMQESLKIKNSFYVKSLVKLIID